MISLLQYSADGLLLLISNKHAMRDQYVYFANQEDKNYPLDYSLWHLRKTGEKPWKF